ncbi:MAG: aminoglycoside phosphotransferase family protein [Methylococcaceae bacterium]
MKSASIIVQHPRQLTVAWAQQILNQHQANIQVASVSINSVDVGTTTRVRLKVQHNAAQLPQHWFVKLPSLAWRARVITALPHLLPNEIRFYQELAKLTPVQLPRCLAAHKQQGRGSTLVLADITEDNALAGKADDVLSFNQAIDVIEQLAKLHAHFWQRAQQYRWLAGSIRQLEDALGTALAVPLMRRGLHLAGEHVPASLHVSALRYAKNRRQVMRFLHNAPQTLVHHDSHAGNLFWDSYKTRVGFLDWQLLRLGEGIGDVAYFLATALEPPLRRQHEIALITRYAQTLTTYGINADTTQLLPRYRAHLSYALEAMLVTLAVGGMMNQHSNLELIRRTASAVHELDSYDVLPL